MLSQSRAAENPVRVRFVSATTNTTCPECGTKQQGDAPFCENCGFRLGRVDTEQEGHRAILRVARPDLATTEVETPALEPRESLAATAIEGVPAIDRATLRDSGTVSTFNEGLDALTETSESAEPTERHPPVAPATVRGHEPYVPAADRSADVAASLDGEGRGRAVLWIALWITSLAAVAMFVWYYAQEAAEETPRVEASGVTRTPMVIEAGPFRQGLNEQVRAFILNACLNQSDDKGRCDQDELLGGEFPEETIELPAYSIDTTEVTVGRYAECVKAGACIEADVKECKVYTHQGLQVALRVPRVLLSPEMPVSCVTRDEAAKFCAWAKGRLPTHSEWERAARGTDGRLFPWGDTWDPDAANWGELDVARVAVVGKVDGHEWAAPPGLFKDGKSPAGAYDMAGNVAEWVAGDDPIKGAARGGSWASNPFDLRTTGRWKIEAATRRADLGFRCIY